MNLLRPLAAARFLLSAIGVAVAGGGVALARKLYRVATFSYDGTQYKGRIVEADYA